MPQPGVVEHLFGPARKGDLSGAGNKGRTMRIPPWLAGHETLTEIVSGSRVTLPLLGRLA